ncbi:MAG: nickel pincer cofactor biosynthesis protein LarC [Oscillospiraceae bacterium]|nr:nickel pincer cofactor biosynthesis protein LarC [Oscillospiraceae bacterium]
MKTLYLDCGMGAAGDMLTAALVELLPDPDIFIKKINALGIPGVKITKEKSVKCGITGTHIEVTVNGISEDEHIYGHDHDHHHEHGHDHEHEHSHEHAHNHSHHHGSIHEIEHIVLGHLQIPENVKKDILAVYSLIAEAESAVHGVPVSEIHFHEVGSMDALADVAAVCLLMDEIKPDKIVASPVHVGSGQVKCAHGILPVPAPATAFILKGIPCFGGKIKGELCTPTGAALLKYFVSSFGEMPVMSVNTIGYGMGKKDFEAANCVRAMLGESEGKTGFISELSCNVDDMTAEEIGFAIEKLFEAGAKEAYTVPIGMKKGRPGTLISVLCAEDDENKMAELLFKHTTTIGVRQAKMRRFVLDREERNVNTPFGSVRIKHSSGYGVDKNKPEYDDLVSLANNLGVSIFEAKKLLEKNI